jgi:hypothetical protein
MGEMLKVEQGRRCTGQEALEMEFSDWSILRQSPAAENSVLEISSNHSAVKPNSKSSGPLTARDARLVLPGTADELSLAE